MRRSEEDDDERLHQEVVVHSLLRSIEVGDVINFDKERDGRLGDLDDPSRVAPILHDGRRGMEDGAVDLDAGQVGVEEELDAEAVEAALRSLGRGVKLKEVGQVSVSLLNLKVEEADLIFLGGLARFVGKVIGPYLRRHLIESDAVL